MNILAFVILAAGLIALLKYVFIDCDVSFIKKTNMDSIMSLIPKEEEEKKDNVDTPYIYLTMYENDKEIGDIVIFLYEKDCPITTKNFKELCSSDNPSFGYKKSIIHRNIHNFMIQGGDFTNANGTGGKSIYNKNFKDENFKYKNKKGSISMANSGPNTNGSQFFINVNDNINLDDKHVVFGKVVEGLELVEYINSRPVDKEDKPLHKIMIHDCGRIWLEETDTKTKNIKPPQLNDKEKYSKYLNEIQKNEIS